MSQDAFLSKVPLFSNCSPTEIAAIAAVAQERTYAAGQIIVTQGTPGQAFFMVLSGRAEILRDSSSLGAFGEGTSSGRCPCSTRRRVPPRSAVDETTCLMLPSWDFKPLLEQHPSIAVKLLEVLSRRLRIADERLTR